jgi:hypothetical protein
MAPGSRSRDHHEKISIVWIKEI